MSFFDFLHKFVSDVPQVHNLGVKQQFGVWTMQDGTFRNEPVTLFSGDLNEFSLNTVKRLLKLRHPNILKLLDTIQTQSKVYIVTERVSILKPLTKNETLWGLYQVASALKFLNDNGLLHGCLLLDSILVTESGEWKLFKFELLSEPQNFSHGKVRFVCDLTDVPWEGYQVTPSCPFAIDRYMFGSLLETLNVEIARVYKNEMHKRPDYDYFFEFLESNVFINQMKRLDQIFLQKEEEQIELLHSINLNECSNQILIKKILPCCFLVLKTKQMFDLCIQIVIRTNTSILPFFELKNKTVTLWLLDVLELLNLKDANLIYPLFEQGYHDVVQIRLKTVQSTKFLFPNLGEWERQGALNSILTLLQDQNLQIRLETLDVLCFLALFLKKADKITLGFCKCLKDLNLKQKALECIETCMHLFSQQEIFQTLIPCVSPICLESNLAKQILKNLINHQILAYDPLVLT